MRKLTIIITIYNQSQYVERFDSCIGHSDSESVEFFFIDDGSTDDSGILCKKYEKYYPNVRYVYQENMGQVYAKKNALLFANGRYVTFVDGDDWVENDFCENITNWIDEYGDLDVIVVPYAIFEDKNSKDAFGYAPEMVFGSDYALVAMFQNTIFNWSSGGKIYKKELIKGILDDMWSYNANGEDTEINYRVFKRANRILYVPYCGYNYYMSKEGLTRNVDESCLEYYKRVEKIIHLEGHQSIVGQYIVDSAFRRAIGKDLPVLAGRRSHTTSEIWDAAKMLGNALWRKKSEYEQIFLDYLQYSYYDALKRYEERRSDLTVRFTKFLRDHSRIYVYGMGYISKLFFELRSDHCVDFDGYIVSKVFPGYSVYNGKKIYGVDDYLSDVYSDKDGIVLAMNIKNSDDVTDVLKKRNLFNENNIFRLGDEMDVLELKFNI